MDGKPIAGDSLTKLSKMAKSMWTNDTYWFLMPYKLRDPGVNLKYGGEAKIGGQTYDKLCAVVRARGRNAGRSLLGVREPRDPSRRSMGLFCSRATSRHPKPGAGKTGRRVYGMWFCTAHRNTEKTNVFYRATSRS